MAYSKETLLQKRIGVLLGGPSAEREVSLSTGTAVAKALRDRGFTVVEIDPDKTIAGKLQREGIDIVFNALHGKWGEDGAVQGLLEFVGIPYTGSGILASSLSMNKVIARLLFRNAGLRVTPGVQIARDSFGAFQTDDLPFPLPVVVKPTSEGSSIGITIVRDPQDMQAALQEVDACGDDALIEQFIAGREINVAVLNDRALGAIEIKPAEEFYNYAAKYTAGTTQYLYPAPVDEALYEELLVVGLAAHRALGCSGVSRVDTIVTGEGDIYVLEVNTLPGMTATSLVPKIAEGLGMSFGELCEQILMDAALHVKG